MATVPKRARSILIGGTVTLALVLLLVTPVYMGFQAFAEIDYQCKRHPVEETFRRFVSPDLTGISDIRAMGESWTAGANVFVRFRATDDALRRLLTGYRSEGTDEAGTGNAEQLASDAEYWSRANPPRSRRYEVSADEIRSLRHPPTYRRSDSVSGTWSILVLDRPHKRAYFYHWSQ